MDVPITRPSMVSYADEVDFSQLLKKLLEDRHNGFMRITSGNDEGYILFKEGKQIAAEYGRFSKSEAIEKIMSAIERNDTVIEIFDLKSSHMDYLTDVNKPFLLEPDFDINKILNELNGLNDAEPLIPEKISQTTNSTEPSRESESDLEVESTKSEEITSKPELQKPETEEKTNIAADSGSEEPEFEQPGSEKPGSEDSAVETTISQQTIETTTNSESKGEIEETQTGSELETESELSEPVDSEPEDVETDKPSPASVETGSIQDKEKTTVSENSTTSTPEKISETSIKSDSDKEEPSKSKDTLKEELKTMESKPQSEIETDVKVPEEPIDRSKLMEKYGIKEMNDEDVEGILDDYKGGSLNEEDVEKIELSLMNKIKKSIFGIPKIKGVEVMVFLENANELTGDINIILEYEAKGFFSRLIGESKDIENLRRQVINIVQIEIKKSFRKYPEIVNNFNINVEIG